MASEKEQKNKSKELYNRESQLVFAIALFLGSLFLFLGIDLISFSWSGSNLEAQALLEAQKGKNFLRANLASKHYPIRDYDQPALQLKAKSYLVFDTENKDFLAEYQPKKEVPIASVSKLLSALVVKENESYYSKKKYLKIPKLKGFPVEPQLKRGGEYGYKDLFRAMLAASNNEAAYSFANEYPGGKEQFLKAMERKAEEIGMEGFNFTNPAGFDRNGGNYASAYDLLLLVNEISEEYPDIFKTTLKKRVVAKDEKNDEPVYLYNTNYFVHNGGVKKVVGQKTGHTSLARDCMVLIEKKDFGKIIYIVLGSQDRVVDMKSLIDWTHETYKFNGEQVLAS